jgi:hypothetical protein
MVLAFTRVPSKAAHSGPGELFFAGPSIALALSQCGLYGGALSSSTKRDGILSRKPLATCSGSTVLGSLSDAYGSAASTGMSGQP